MIEQLADNLFIHMRSIHNRTIGDADRAVRSVIDHMHIIEALERRDAGLAETLVREHSMRLAEHIRKYAEYLD